MKVEIPKNTIHKLHEGSVWSFNRKMKKLTQTIRMPPEQGCLYGSQLVPTFLPGEVLRLDGKIFLISAYEAYFTICSLYKEAVFQYELVKGEARKREWYRINNTKAVE